MTERTNLMIDEVVIERRATMPVREHLYTATLRLTGITEYGISLQDIYSGSAPIPPQGVRIDLPFEGVIEGPKLNGTIRGVDFGEMRADGRFDLNLQAEATFVAANLRYQGPDSIPAGSTHLHLVNEGADAHHIQIVKLTGEKSAVDLLAALEESAVWPDWAPTYGGPNAVIPGESSNALVHLDA